MPDAQTEPNIHDFPWLTEELGIDVNKLGCVMLPVQFRSGYVERGYDIGMIDPSDLYTAANPEHFWIKGDVSEDPHITLLYGLIEPAYDNAELLDRLLAQWRKPSWLPVKSFDVFPSPLSDEDYLCIVAHIGDRDGILAQARGLISYIPHVDTFPEYKPHATVAYVKPEAAERWLAWLNHGPRAVEVPATVNGQRFDYGSAK